MPEPLDLEPIKARWEALHDAMHRDPWDVVSEMLAGEFDDNAPDDIAALIAEVERLREKLARERVWLRFWSRHWED